MKERHVTAALSAYLDGMAGDPDGIRRHLESCAACTRHYEALRAQAAALRALPDPAPDPRFVARVAARTASATSGRCSRARPAWVAAACMAAACLGGLGWFAVPRAPEPTPGALHALDWTDEDALLAELSRLSDAGADLRLLEVGLLGGEAYPVALSPEESLGALAQAAVESYASPDPLARAEADVVLNEMTDAERAALRALLESSQP